MPAPSHAANSLPFVVTGLARWVLTVWLAASTEMLHTVARDTPHLPTVERRLQSYQHTALPFPASAWYVCLVPPSCVRVGCMCGSAGVRTRSAGGAKARSSRALRRHQPLPLSLSLYICNERERGDGCGTQGCTHGARASSGGELSAHRRSAPARTKLIIHSLDYTLVRHKAVCYKNYTTTTATATDRGAGFSSMPA
jgi:hypothetical protein